MKKHVMSLLLLLVMLSGCAVQAHWTPTGGSRSDGVVRMAYEYGEMEKVTIDHEQGLALAEQRCQSWGYSGAEAFGGHTKVCNQYGGVFSNCARWLVTKEFQCVGQGNEVSLNK